MVRAPRTARPTAGVMRSSSFATGFVLLESEDWNYRAGIVISLKGTLGLITSRAAGQSRRARSAPATVAGQTAAGV